MISSQYLYDERDFFFARRQYIKAEFIKTPPVYGVVFWITELFERLL